MEANIPNAVQHYIDTNWNKNGLLYTARYLGIVVLYREINFD